MDSLRKWFYKPKRDDRSLLAQFFFADEALNLVAAELDSFDGRENPERCSTLVNQLRHCQERVLNITGQIMDQLLGSERVPRGFRVKFPEDVLHENLAGQLWFGAECLAAGSSIMHREVESVAMRPLARALTLSLEKVRGQLRDHCLRCNRYGAPSPQNCTENLYESLKIFDRLFAEFELCYVSAMVPVKTPQEFEMQQLICVLFSETLQRARKIGLLTQDQIDDYDPALMFAIPRLAIVSGLLIFSSGPLSIDKSPELMSDMFRPFRSLLYKIRKLLWTLDRRELYLLEKLLCTNEDIADIRLNVDFAEEGSFHKNSESFYPEISEFVTRFYSDYSHCGDVLNYVGCDWTAKNDANSVENPQFQQQTTETEANPNTFDADAGDFRCMRRLQERYEILKQSNAGSTENFVYNASRNAATFHLENENSSEVNDESTKDPNENANLENDTHSSSQVTPNPQSSEVPTRNLSSDALLLFDPLVQNSADQASYENLEYLQSAMSGDEQPSSISYGEYPENNLDGRNHVHVDSSITNLLHNQMSGQIFSFSTSDVSNLAATDADPEFEVATNVANTYSPSRNGANLTQMPSTSHGFLIRNAISHEPVIMASLANNAAVYEEGGSDSMIDPMLANLTASGSIFEDSNLSSLLLTNENFHNAYMAQGIFQNAESSDSANQFPTGSINDGFEISPSDSVGVFNQSLRVERQQFDNNGYESDSNDQTLVDSGICTENTSLDRSPDLESKDLDEDKREKPTSVQKVIDIKDSISPSTSDSFCINYSESTDNVEKNEAGPSNRLIMQTPEFIQSHNTAKTSDTSVKDSVSVSKFDENESNNPCDSNLCSHNAENNASETPSESNRLRSSYDIVNSENCDSNITLDNLNLHGDERTLVPIAEDDNNSNDSRSLVTSGPRVVINGSSPVEQEHSSSMSATATGMLNQRKLKKASPNKNKKRKSKSRDSRPLSPGTVFLQNRAYAEQRTPVKLNLDQFVDDGANGSCSSQSSATSSFHSEWADDEEIALALQAHEFASRHQTRAKFRSSEDLIHRLFVCIAGVADQLQTNFASDLRNILKSVFLMNQTPEVEDPPPPPEEEQPKNEEEEEASEETTNPGEEDRSKRRGSAIEYEVSASEVMSNGGSFDSIHSAEEVYADNNSPVSQRSRQSSRLSDSNQDESVENNLNDSQSLGQTDQISPERLNNNSRRNTISSVISGNKQSPPSEGKMISRRLSNRSSSSSLESQQSIENQNGGSPIIGMEPSRGDCIDDRTDRYGNRENIREYPENVCIRDRSLRSTQSSRVERAPEWVPDIAAPDCMRCGAHFTAFRRRHHCRNCGKVFCASCSANSIPLPRFGQLKPVRVCEECFQLMAKRTCAPRPISTNANGNRRASYTHR